MATVADYLLKALHEEGVEYIFGYPGGAALNIYDAIYRQAPIQHILVRHEQAAVHMAEGYSKATNKIGVALATSGPGATNCITGLANAYMDSTPLILLTGQVPMPKIGTDAFQETDMLALSRPIAKHSFLVSDPAKILETVKKAFYIATSGRPGPVVIDLPRDITAMKPPEPFSYPESVQIRAYTPPKQGNKKQVKRAMSFLQEAKKPLLLVGGGAKRGETPELLKQLITTHEIPTVSTFMGLGVVPGELDQCLGMLGLYGNYSSNMVAHNSDLIISIGARFDDRVALNVEKFCPSAKIVHVDIDASSISKTVHADVPIVGDAEMVVEQFLVELNSGDYNIKDGLIDWWSDIEKYKRIDTKHEQDQLRAVSSTGRAKPQQVVRDLYEVTKGDAYITTDVGQHQMFAALHYKYATHQQLVSSGGLGTMGFGLPAAIGVKFARPDSSVVCITSEGSVQMNIQEISTCMQYKIPIKILCLNNEALGMVKQWQDMDYQGRYANSYMESVPDFAMLAQSYGAVGVKITQGDDVKAKLDLYINSPEYRDKFVFLDVDVDPSEHNYPMLRPMGGLNEMFLHKDDLEK